MSEDLKQKIKVILDDYGYDDKDFDVIEKDNDQKEIDEDAVQKLIMISNKKSGKHHTYENDEYGMWVNEFENDLQDERFN